MVTCVFWMESVSVTYKFLRNFLKTLLWRYLLLFNVYHWLLFHIIQIGVFLVHCLLLKGSSYVKHLLSFSVFFFTKIKRCFGVEIYTLSQLLQWELKFTTMKINKMREIEIRSYAVVIFLQLNVGCNDVRRCRFRNSNTKYWTL